VTLLPQLAVSDMVGTVPGTSENAAPQGPVPRTWPTRTSHVPDTGLGPKRHAPGPSRRRARTSSLATIVRVTEESAQPLEQQLEEIRTQLAWVRDYL
jgi:hypothetical protein